MDTNKVQILICPLCGGDSRSTWNEAGYYAFRCKRCGVVFSESRNNPFLYDKNYFYRWYIRSAQKRKRYLKKILKKIERKYTKLPEGNYLDVGCGAGIFLDIAKQNHWKAVGVDISPAALAYCRQKKFNVIQGHLSELSLPSGYFDVVVLFDVIAHIENPVDYLKEIKRVIRDDGLVIIKTPKHPSRLFYIARLFKFTRKSRVLLHIPAQIFHFEETSLQKFCFMNGFNVVCIFTLDDIPGFFLKKSPVYMLLFFLQAFLKIFCGRNSMVAVCQKKI